MVEVEIGLSYDIVYTRRFRAWSHAARTSGVSVAYVNACVACLSVRKSPY